MSYLVLARKWRPQTFADLVGQAHVSRTLENAIAQDRVAHAFLFTGVRGVGKTTSARILAKALNCVQGPTATPCLVCPACVEIAAGSDIDVQEIDGASYNGVDEVRRLQESLPYRPQRDRFKIFIVDEVHMLSQSAWNAFLKTLEEPPPHVKFIFATTEAHKVPVTILSRCQRYDFKMIAAQTIAGRLRYVLGQERIVADDGTVNLLAREASGSMRDAMSLLDQAIAWGGTTLVGEEVARVLGVVSRAVVHKLATSLVEGRAESSLALVAGLVEQGYDLTHLTRDLLAHLRDLVVAKVCAEDRSLLDLSDEEANEVRSLAARSDADDLVRLHQGLSRSYDDIARSPQPRAALEMTLVRLARRPPLVPLDELLGRLGDLEKRLGGAGPAGAGRPGGRPAPAPAPTPGPGSRPGAGPSQAFGRPAPVRVGNPDAFDASSARGATSFADAPGARGATALAAPQVYPPVVDAVPQAVVDPVPASRSAVRPVPLVPPAAVVTPAPRALPPADPALRSVFVPPEAPVARPIFASTPDEASEAEAPTRPSPVPPSRGPTRGRNLAPSGAPDPSIPPPDAPPGVDMTLWARVVARVRKVDAPLASVLECAVPTALDAQRVVLAYPPDTYLAARASEPQTAELLTRAVRDEIGASAAVTIELSPDTKNGLTLARIAAHAAWKRRDHARREVENHPLVRAVIEVLGGELRDVAVAEDKG